jgi:hypothetical protein
MFAPLVLVFVCLDNNKKRNAIGKRR